MHSLTAAVVAAQALIRGASCQDSTTIDSFIPTRFACPEDGSAQVRAANNLSEQEDAWRSTRAVHVVDAITSWLTRVNISGFDTQAYADKLNTTNVPIIGLAISGGGTTSGIGGLGIWQALDERYEPASEAGTGGIAQSLTYITGLSGGGALTVSTLASNQFATLDDIRQAINFTEDYTTGPTGNQSEYVESLVPNVFGKYESNFPVSVVDIFGQWWSMYLQSEWRDRRYSDLAVHNTSFSNGTGPMPILSLAEIVPGESPTIGNISFPGRNSTNGFNLTEYEVTPFEFGSWVGGRVQGFMPLQFLGTAMSAGQPSGVTCVTGFDRFSFFQGITANAFNVWLIQAFYDIPLFAKRALSSLVSGDLSVRQDGGGDAGDGGSDGDSPGDIQIPESQQDSGQAELVNITAGMFQQTFNDSLWAWVPNPFQDYNDAMMGVSDLLLLDGSEAGETDPLRPLMIPQRGVDLIMVYEASLDATNYWNNGTNLYNSAQAAEQGGIPFPKIPTVATMVLRKYAIRPTLFGCSDDAETPLVLYLPNAPWSSYSNYSYMKTSFTDRQMDATLENAFNIATYGNGKVPEGEGWASCLACAAIKKSVERVGMALPDACGECWSRFCWDGVEETRKVDDVGTVFDLVPVLNPGLTWDEWNETVWSG